MTEVAFVVDLHQGGNPPFCSAAVAVVAGAVVAASVMLSWIDSTDSQGLLCCAVSSRPFEPMEGVACDRFVVDQTAPNEHFGTYSEIFRPGIYLVAPCFVTC